MEKTLTTINSFKLDDRIQIIQLIIIIKFIKLYIYIFLI